MQGAGSMIGLVPGIDRHSSRPNNAAHAPHAIKATGPETASDSTEARAVAVWEMLP